MLIGQDDSLQSKKTFEAYMLYLALSRHFTTKSYDYFKYNGKVKANFESFMKRKDRIAFSKLAKHIDPKGLIISNYLTGNKVYVYELVNNESCSEIYNEWKKRNDALSYCFKKELNFLKDTYMDNLTLDKDDQFPYLLKLVIQGKVSMETLIILNSLTPFFEYWNENISPPLMWERINTLSIKYEPFMNFDMKKMKAILVDKFNTK